MNFTTATDANGVDDAPADFLIDWMENLQQKKKEFSIPHSTFQDWTALEISGCWGQIYENNYYLRYFYKGSSKQRG
jgi:hypothetical protein